ncbi:MAG: response regulator [FCB group bacterium]|nr:response regulator [FCB group bacterium]
MKTIVVVEDNADNLLLVQAILEGDYKLITFDNGVSALQELANLTPDLILLDISLPGMDGVEVLENIRQNPTMKPVPVIALTAHSMAGDREKYLELGFNDYYSKPIVDMDDFSRMVAKYTENIREQT